MKWGWLAAAAVMACASQAEAARFYEFEIIGTARVTGYDPFGIQPPVVFDRLSRFTVAFDTGITPTPLGNVAYGVPETWTYLAPGVLQTLNMPGGTFFNLTFDMGAITGSTFQLMRTGGSYGYHDCGNRYRVCTDSPAVMFAVSARTSDVAPAFLGSSESVLATAVPEPTTWATMIAGMAAVGHALRRRGRQRLVRA